MPENGSYDGPQVVLLPGGDVWVLDAAVEQFEQFLRTMDPALHNQVQAGKCAAYYKDGTWHPLDSEKAYAFRAKMREARDTSHQDDGDTND